MAGKLVQNNWQQINEVISEAARRAGRFKDQVRVVGVAKKQTVSRVQAALEAGLKILGENYAQEFLMRQKYFPLPQIEWHFVGHLQSNKAKMVVGQVELIHSVDRISLAKKIGQVAQKKNITQSILVEINVDAEPNKSGVLVEKAPQLLESIQKISGVRLCGLMAMPSLEKSGNESRACFARVRQLTEQWKFYLSPGSAGHHFNELSMGTTSDFSYAIEEGATLVRLGTSLFGPRE